MLNLLSRDETSNVPTETIGLDNETSLKNILEKFMSQGQLSSQEISLVKQEIRTQNNPEKWHSLFDSINLEFHEEVSIIRFLVFQSLIIPEDVITLFQRLVWFDDETSWKIFKDTQQTLTSLSPEINQPSKEGAWLLINQIIENRYRVKMVKKLGYRLLNAGNLESKFFPEKGIWREALRLSLREMLENYEKNNSLSFSSDNMQIFLENIEQPQYKRKNKIGYYHLLAILENLNRNRDFTNFKFLQALISNKVKGKVSDALYREIKNQPHVNYPKFVNSLNKELTLNEKLKIVSKKLNKMYNYLTKTRYLPFIPKGVWYNTPVPRQKVMTILSKINDIVFSVNIVLFFVCLLFVALYNLKVNIHFTHFTLKEIYPYLIKCMWINGYIFTAQIIMLIFYFLIWLIRQPMNNR